MYKNMLNSCLPDYLFNELVDTVGNRKVIYRINLKNRLFQKFEDLRASLNDQRGIVNPKWVIDLSDRKLKNDEKSILQKCLNFCSNTKIQKNVNHLLANLDNVLEYNKNLNSNDKVSIKNKVCAAIKSIDV